MNDFIKTVVKNKLGSIILDRPKALNSLSLDMVRNLSATLLRWRTDPNIDAVIISSSSERAFCAGGDIRFFYEMGRSTPMGGSALLEDFFTEEYSLNHLIHSYPKPYIALLNGIVMGGGMGISQGGTSIRIVTENTRMAMPEVNIGFFPDVGASYFLSRTPGQIGAYLAVTGATIEGRDALYAGLADVYIPARELPSLIAVLETANSNEIQEAVNTFAAGFQEDGGQPAGMLAEQRTLIDKHFSADSISAILGSLAQEDNTFAHQTLTTMKKRSPLMMCVALAQIRLGKTLSFADCLRMERTMARRAFEHGNVLEGIRAAVIDKDNMPQWLPSTVAEVSAEMVERFFEPAWPRHAHPLRELS